MDCSQCPIPPTLKPVFFEYAKKSADIVRSHGARPIFFMSWACADKPEMTAELAEAYTIAGTTTTRWCADRKILAGGRLGDGAGLLREVNLPRAGHHGAGCRNRSRRTITVSSRP